MSNLEQQFFGPHFLLHSYLYIEVRKEKHCYNRLIKVVRDMKMDVMKSVMKDKPAAERLRKSKVWSLCKVFTT